MRAGVKPGFKVKGRQNYRVIDLDDPEEKPIHNRDGNPIDGGGHRLEGISQSLAEEVNETLRRRGLLAED